MNNPVINKVAESGIVTINLEEFYPADEISVFDLKEFLFMGLILKEKDFREALKNLDIEKFRNKIVALTCSADAVIPMWAYMLVSSLLQPVAEDIIFGNREQAVQTVMLKRINNIDLTEYSDKRVVIKGCGEIAVTEPSYIEITKLLRPVAKSIMYGEPCSTVPVFKKPANRPSL